MINRTSRTENRQSDNILTRLFSLVIIFAIAASLAIVREGSFFGKKISSEPTTSVEAVSGKDGTIVVNTTPLAGEVAGYAGAVPVEIYITDSRIDSIHPLPNSESPRFFSRLSSEGLFSSLNGKTIEEACKTRIDAVSGATYSSNAAIANIKAGLNYAAGLEPSKQQTSHNEIALIAALVVIAMGTILPYFIHNKVYRTIQQLLNVGVLGFWAGTFINYAVMFSFIANGLTASLASVVTLALLAVGYILPLFRQPNRYCSWICPMGSLQGLAGQIFSNKIKLGSNTISFLNILRDTLWGVLLILLWIGVGTQWVDNEIFTAFAVKSASWTVIGVGVFFILLSVVIDRPFCRFVCPTGTMMRKAYNLKNN